MAKKYTEIAVISVARGSGETTIPDQDRDTIIQLYKELLD